MSAKSPTARSSESTAIAEGIQQHLAQDEAVVAPKADVDSFSEKDVVWFLAIEKARPEAKIEKEAFITPTSKRRLEWKALAALDSLRLERAFRSWIAGKPEGSSRVTINGDLYQVDISKRIAYPLYWMAPPQRVIRATWLFDLDEPLPCGEAVASEIEYHYQQGAWRKMSPPTRISLTGNLSVMFFSETEIRFYPDDVTTQLALLLKNEKMSGIPIRRAPAKPFQPSNEFIPFERFSHLVFVIHGIGQKIEEFDIINDANYLRMTVNNLLLQNCGDELYQNGIQILPVQWRKDLDLPCDSTEVEQVSLSEVTLNTLQFFRNALNATFVDVLLYMTPNHRDRIHTNVINRINHLYATFISRHPDFVKEGGKVSVVGHSLGSVITFDLLCHQFETSYVPSPDVDASQTRAQPEPDDSPAVAALKRQLLELEKKIVAEKTLRRGGSHCFDFEVSSFFMLGSPLGVFLTLREDTIHPDIHQPGQSNVFPKCEQLYNIFHPFDPVAYRVEPLVQRSMAQSKPAYVLSSKGGKKFHIELQEKKEELVQKSEEIKKMMLMQFSSFKSSFFGAPSPAPEPEKRKEALEDFPPLKGSSKSVLNTLGDGRIDYVVQDDFFENALIGAVVSHLSYWRNEDVAMFMLKKLYDTSLFVQKK